MIRGTDEDRYNLIIQMDPRMEGARLSVRNFNLQTLEPHVVL